MKKTKALVLSTITAFALIGCGGGSSGGGNSSSSGTTVTATPTLIDDKVSGVKYINGANSGFTNANGKFPYTSGTVDFYLGNIKLGSLSSIPSDKNVFIQDVVGVDRTDTSNTKVLKIASLLQSLDSDTSTDTIEIKEEDFNKFNDVSTTIDENTDVSSTLTAKGFVAKSQTDIIEHLISSQKKYQIVSDTIAPSITASSITNGQTNVLKTASINITFSEAIPKEYLTNEYFKLVNDSNNSIVEIRIDENATNIKITPTTVLSYSSSYSLVIDSKLKDFAGNNLSTTNTIISFTTESETDTTAPTITSASTFSVNENQTTAFTVSASDNKSSVTYGLSGTDSSLFDINQTTGIVTFKTNSDFEIKPSYSVTVNVKDASNNTSSQNVTITINDVDENAPTITSATTFTVNENQMSAFTATATDISSISSYALSGTDVNSFNIDSTTGVVTFKSKPDFETKPSYSIILTATDSLNNSAIKTVNINIANLDESSPTTTIPPVFTSSDSVAVNENQTSVITAMATSTVAVTYSISGTDVSFFNINPTTGVITFKTLADYDTQFSYYIVVTATDSSNNRTSQDLYIDLIDVDDTGPVITSPSSSSVSVAENQTSAFTVTAQDDSNIIVYSIEGTDASLFNINSTSGVVTFKTKPDYESGKTSYSLTVKATDSSNNYSTKAVTVNILDVIENPTITFKGLEYGIVTSPITHKKWLDRNLGASRACTSSTDTACYGDYYQWGRLADGHEKSNSPTAIEQATDITNAGEHFINSGADWIADGIDNDGSLRATQWSKADGSGICPNGFRVPTALELTTETLDIIGIDNLTLEIVKVTSSWKAFQNFLKLPVAGLRDSSQGVSSMGEVGYSGLIWTTATNNSQALVLYFNDGNAYSYDTYRQNGASVRCRED